MSGPIRVCYLIDDLTMGGTEEHLLDVVRRLDRSAVAPAVCCLQAKGAIGERVEAAGVPVTVLDLERIYGRGVVRAASRLAGLLRARRTQVLHTYLPSANIFGAVVARLAGVPHLVTTRRDMGFSRNWRLALLERLLANPRADRVVAVSEAVRRRTVGELRTRRDRVVVIPNGLDLGEWTATPVPSGDPVVVMAAALTPIKAPQIFVEAAARVVAGAPRARFLVVGDGPLRQACEHRAAALGLGDRLQFLGTVTRERVRDSMRGAWVSVLTSLSEGMPNVVLEAMALARPVVATRVGGTPELVRDGINGLLVPPADPEAVAAAIARLVRDCELSARMGRAGRRRVEEEFDVRTMVHRMEGLYRELVGGTGIARAA